MIASELSTPVSVSLKALDHAVLSGMTLVYNLTFKGISSLKDLTFPVYSESGVARRESSRAIVSRCHIKVLLLL